MIAWGNFACVLLMLRLAWWQSKRGDTFMWFINMCLAVLNAYVFITLLRGS